MSDSFQAWCCTCNRAASPYFDSEEEATDHILEVSFCESCGTEFDEHNVEVLNATKAFGVRPITHQEDRGGREETQEKEAYKGARVVEARTAEAQGAGASPYQTQAGQGTEAEDDRGAMSPEDRNAVQYESQGTRMEMKEMRDGSVRIDFCLGTELQGALVIPKEKKPAFSDALDIASKTLKVWK